MKKIYLYLSVITLFMTFSNLHSQVLETQNFEDGSMVTDFPGWFSPLPPFILTTSNACEGSQAIKAENNATTLSSFVRYLSPNPTTGEAITVSFDYKITGANGTTPVSGNFGTIDLQYTADGGTTWTTYETLDQTDVQASGCANHSFTIPAANLPAGSNFGWKLITNRLNGSFQVFVDDFYAYEELACIQPVYVDIDETSITTTGADISWQDINNPNAAQYEVSVCTLPGLPGNVAFCTNTIVTGNNSISLTGLNDATNYYVYIRALCGGTNGDSSWSEVVEFQTIAIGSSCNDPLVINADPNNPVAADLPYTQSGQTMVYGDFESGTPGANCGVATAILNGYEVVYEYTSSQDDILEVNVTNLPTNANVGLFVYESCADIGNFCVAGGFSDDGTPINVNSIFINQGETYYFVLASTDNTFEPLDASYTIDIEGFDCNTWTPPNGATNIQFVTGQTLNDFSDSSLGVQPTITGATLTWYQDNNGAQGAAITTNLASINLNDQDVYWVTQNIGNCESPALQVTFDEFDCNTDLAGITSTTNAYVCESGSMTLQATAADPNKIYWYDAPTGGEVVAVGSSFTTPNLTQTTPYWVSEVFLGEGQINGQGKPGPTTISTSSSTNYGLDFTVNQPMTIVSIDVYSAGSGNLALELQDANGNPTGDVALVPLNSGTSNNPTLTKVNLNWEITNPGDYRLVKTNNANLLYSTSSNASFPYALGQSGEVTGGRTSWGTSSNYYYFYNWTITGPTVLCETTRTQVDAVVEDIIPTTVSADNTLVCVGDPVNLSVTSTDPDYVYTWEWTSGGQLQTDTGANITVNPNGNTTYTVTAVNSVTNCEYVNTIDIITKGISFLPVAPTTVDICKNDVVALEAGSIIYDFESGAMGWTNVNNSTVQVTGLNPNSSDWVKVNSPYSIKLTSIASNDNSSFYISNADDLGPGASLDASLVSPSIDLAGVSSAELTFYHYFKGYFSNMTNQTTSARVEVSVDQGAWQLLKEYDAPSPDVGTPDNFAVQTIDLSNYTGSNDVRVRFRHEGGWGWYWAVDNVSVARSYLDAQVEWTPTTDLYFDDQGTLPYDGSPASVVYVKGNANGQTTYTASLDVLGCNPVTNTVTVNVTEVVAPTGAANQTYTGSGTISDLVVTGTNLKWYVLDNNGDYQQVTINEPLSDGQTYYVTQSTSNCESDYLAVTVAMECPEATNVTVNASKQPGSTTAGVVVTWTEPAMLDGVVDYELILFDSQSNQVAQKNVAVGNDFAIFQNLALDEDYTLEFSTICDGNSASPVRSNTETINFDTNNLSSANPAFIGFNFYPNPTSNLVNFENQIEMERLEVYDISGKQIMVKQVNNNRAQIDFSALASGSYFVKVVSNQTAKMVRIIRD